LESFIRFRRLAAMVVTAVCLGTVFTASAAAKLPSKCPTASAISSLTGVTVQRRAANVNGTVECDYLAGTSAAIHSDLSVDVVPAEAQTAAAFEKADENENSAADGLIQTTVLSNLGVAAIRYTHKNGPHYYSTRVDVLLHQTKWAELEVVSHGRLFPKASQVVAVARSLA
jgi:hypothetical protein